MQLFDPEPQKIAGVIAKVIAENEKAGAGLHVAVFVYYDHAQHTPASMILFNRDFA
jgi:hypothetical protein